MCVARSVVKIQTKSTSPTKSGRATSRKAQPWGAKHPKNLIKWAPKGLKWPKCVPKRRFFLECRGCAPERRVVKQAVVNPCPKPGWSSKYIFTTLAKSIQAPTSPPQGGVWVALFAFAHHPAILGCFGPIFGKKRTHQAPRSPIPIISIIWSSKLY